MSSVAIQAEGLGKLYSIGRRQDDASLRETITGVFSAPLRALAGSRSRHAADDSTIWALKDVSFDVARGEALGIIGRNGAGKSTLLKVLSRITNPTEGRCVLRGRVGSLLEVGTGFHSELTGRENIFLNGAILGMSGAEIRRKFDEIVAFAEVERFIDTPVKRYSSGMYMRLAFAVAAHLDFEILLVDEVLAVGDLLFQQKCLGKMRDVSQEGRTVLFVSHNMSAMSMLTQRCMWIDQGRLVTLGETSAVIHTYATDPFRTALERSSEERGTADLRDPRYRQGVRKATSRQVTFARLRLLDPSGRVTDTFYEGDPILVELELDVRDPITTIDLVARVRGADGYLVFSPTTGKRWVSLEPGVYRTRFEMRPNLLRPDWYYVELFMVTGASVAQDAIPEAIAFNILGRLAQEENPRYAREKMGVIRVDYAWDDLERVGETAAALPVG